jgi:hypothetical protein
MLFQSMRSACFVLVAAGTLLLAACDFSINAPTSGDPKAEVPPPDIPSLPATVKRVTLDSSGKGSITLPTLNNQNVFLATVNISGTTKSAASSSVSSVGQDTADTVILGANGGEEQVARAIAGAVTIDGQTLTRYEPQFRIALPPQPETSLTVSRSAAANYKDAKEGDTKSFYVGQIYSPMTSEQTTATLKKSGMYCNIWVVGANFDDSSSDDDAKDDNKVTQTQVNALAEKFDLIYPLETNLLGFERGGETSGNGGSDGDKKIQILVFDIQEDFGKARSSVTYGYFFPGDEYSNAVAKLNGFYSNEAEIFYLDSEFMDKKPSDIYSTLVHEFNHMINFNVKVLQTGKNENWEAWFTEMLSMLAEDTIGPLVGIEAGSEGHVISGRIPYWLACYADYGVMQWNNTLEAYSSNYAFGAYLVRNFGGAQFFSKIAKSPKGGRDSLEDQLKANGSSVDEALARFAETLIYSGANKTNSAYTFNQTVTKSVGGKDYTFAAFDVWSMTYELRYTDNTVKEYTGPLIYKYTGAALSIPPYAMRLFSRNDWQNKKGSLTINVTNGIYGAYCFTMIQ